MISFNADGKDYKLEVTANTIRVMERNGVKFVDLDDTLLLGVETLWKGLFIAHHNTVPDKKRMEIYNALTAVADGNEPEYDEYGEPIDALMSAIGAEYKDAIDKVKRSQGNVVWKRT